MERSHFRTRACAAGRTVDGTFAEDDDILIRCVGTLGRAVEFHKIYRLNMFQCRVLYFHLFVDGVANNQTDLGEFACIFRANIKVHFRSWQNSEETAAERNVAVNFFAQFGNVYFHIFLVEERFDVIKRNGIDDIVVF